MFAPKEQQMIYKIVALAIIFLLIVIDYSMLVVASRADRQAERMYRKWKNETDRR